MEDLYTVLHVKQLPGDIMQVKLSTLAVMPPTGEFLVEKALNDFMKSEIVLKYKFLINDILTVIKPKLDNYRARQMELLKEHGREILDENGQVVALAPTEDKIAFVQDELAKMGDLDIDLPVDKFKRDEFLNVVTKDDSVKWLDWLFEK